MQMLVDEDTFVPKDYEELVRVYTPYVTRLVQRYNRVTANFEDLLQHMWQKLLEADVIEKYHKSTGNQARQITGEQAALYLKMTWNQFKMFMHRGHVGYKRPVLQSSMVDKVMERDHGICREACHGDEPLDTILIARSLRKLMEERPAEYKAKRKEMRKNWGFGEKTWRFWDVEVVDESAKGIDKYKTVCLFCLARKTAGEAKRVKTGVTLSPVKGTRGSKKALYDVMDVERVRVFREESKRCKEQAGYQPFEIPQTKSRFKLYLARAVHNHYANWCRTRSRKYKELYLAPTEEGQAWESFLEDDGLADPEAKMIVTEEINNNVDRVVDKLAKRVKEGKISREIIVERLAQGHTISEILKEFELPRATLQVVQGRYG